MADDKKGREQRGSEGFLSELSSFRREAMNVSEEDMRSWREEVLKTREAQKSSGTTKRSQPKSRGQRVNPAAVFMFLLVVGIALTTRKTPPADTTGTDPQTPASAGVVAGSPAPGTQAVVLDDAPVVPVEAATFDLMRETALAAWELDWVRPRVLARYPAPHALEESGPWEGLTGPAVRFAPFAARIPLERAIRSLGVNPLPPLPEALEELQGALANQGDPLTELVKAFLEEDDAAVASRADEVREAGGPPGGGGSTDLVVLLEALSKLRAGGTPARTLEELGRLAATNARVGQVRAMLLLSEGEAPGALAALDAVAGSDQDRLGAALGRAWIQRVTGDAATCRKTLEALAGRDPSPVAARILLASLAQENQDLLAVRQLLLGVEDRVDVLGLAERAAFEGLFAGVVEPPDSKLEPGQIFDISRVYLQASREHQPMARWGELNWARLGALERRRIASEESFRSFLRGTRSLPVRTEMARYFRQESLLALAFGQYRFLMARPGRHRSVDSEYRGLVSQINRDDLKEFVGLATPESIQ